MKSFGESLKTERELRGISFRDLYHKTKINPIYLSALEEEKFDKLPPKAITIGFIRSICRTLGLDAEQFITDFEHASKTPTSKSNGKKAGNTKLKAGKSFKSFAIACAIFILIGFFIGATAYVYSRSDLSKKAIFQRKNRTATDQGSSKTAASEVNTVSSDFNHDPIKIKVIAKAPILATVVIDDNLHQSQKLENKEYILWSAKKRLAITVSDDNQVELFVGDNAFPIESPKGGINTFIFDESNISTVGKP